MKTVFQKPQRRDTPKTVRLTEHQHRILARLQQLKGNGATATDIMLEALDQYTRKVLRDTKDEQLRRLVAPKR